MKFEKVFAATHIPCATVGVPHVSGCIDPPQAEPACEHCAKGVPRIFQERLNGLVHRYSNCNAPCTGPSGWPGGSK